MTASGLLLGSPLLAGSLALVAKSVLEMPPQSGGIVELVIAGIVAPTVIWALNRQSKKEDRNYRMTQIASERRDRLLALQVKTQRKTHLALEGVRKALLATKAKVDSLECRAPCPDENGGPNAA